MEKYNDIIIATKNSGKVDEIKKILKDLPFDVKCMKDVGMDDEIDECGTTFEENAMIKAKYIFDKTGSLVIADDSGLEIDYLNGEPGIYSARFAGENASYEEKINLMLSRLEGVSFEDRTARFVCAVAVCLPDGGEFVVRDTCEGYIALEPKGENGFGYDPIFYMKEYDMTTAQLEPDEKNRISHRGKALKKMEKKLKDMLK